ncbi:F0F1 ATP synthase subunit A [Oceanotoga sp. DSM 15011]|uniref:F0F1 ATP synthase subunit A n=1 Tax=Oceanotoga sp. DSM 15011 TaxID=2984951 RepID=UPI0021F44B95|nr:F0F1 ATP synthase subunit A [Oceanotoga sp. DSM 15011]UYP00639.1 F0F1 ATP synthase subunit A [Oceanotoga sp. DSM 15011]
MLKEKKLKNTIILFFALYVILGIVNVFTSKSELEGVGQRWIVEFGNGGFLGQINPMTVLMSGLIILIIILFAKSVKFERIPGRKQSIVELMLDYFWELVEDSVPDQKYRKPTFVISMSLFLFIGFANILSGMPGISVLPTNSGLSVQLFTDTWYTPTSDLNTNLTFALMVFIISHVFAAKSKGVGKWLKSFIEPNPIMLPLNLISEIAKPVSHSLRLFGNIMGGGILVLIISYMLKYFVIPIFLWGFFGWFVGLIQAFVFALLSIAYIGSLLE